MKRWKHGLSFAIGLGLIGCRLDLENKASDEPDSAYEGRERDEPATSGNGGNGGTRSTSNPQRTATSELIGVPCSAYERLALAAAPPAADGGVTRLRGLIAITRSAHFDGEVIIEPGTTFAMAADSSLEFGWAGTKTALTARGTSELPIRLCRDRPTLGHWEGLLFSRAVSSDSIAEHVLVSGARGAEAALTVHAPVVLHDITVEGAEGVGVAASVFGDTSARFLVKGSGSDAFVLTHQAAVATFPEDVRCEDNALERVRLTLDSYAGPITVRALPVPYFQERSVDVQDGLLEFSAGVDYRFAKTASLLVGWAGSKSELQIRGTASAPVLFTGENADSSEPGAFPGLAIDPPTSSVSKISHLIVRNGGGNQAAPLRVSTVITLEDVTIENAARPALIQFGLQPESKNLTIRGSVSHPLETYTAALTSLPRGGTFTGNGDDTIHVLQSSSAELNGTIANLGVPYLVDTNLTLSTGDVTIAPGSEFVFASGYVYSVTVGWAGAKTRLIAAGTADQPIVFRSQDGKRGGWGGIAISPSTTSTSQLDYVQVSDASLTLSLPLAINHSTFRNSPTFGIVKPAADTTDYSIGNTFADNVEGPIGNR